MPERFFFLNGKQIDLARIVRMEPNQSAEGEILSYTAVGDAEQDDTPGAKGSDRNPGANHNETSKSPGSTGNEITYPGTDGARLNTAWRQFHGLRTKKDKDDDGNEETKTT